MSVMSWAYLVSSFLIVMRSGLMILYVHDTNILNQTTMRLDVVRKLCQCPAKAGDIVYQHIAPSGLHLTFKRGPSVSPWGLHRYGTP